MTYTYLIGWTKHDRWYYGMRSANKAAPHDDLWKIYKTSSVYVHKFTEEFGEPDVIKVHKEFDNKDQAYLFETKFLRRVGAIRNERWINQNIMGRPQGGTPAQLAAVSKPQSEEHKRKRGVYNKKSMEWKSKLSVIHSGEKNPMFGRTGDKHPGYGKKRTPEQIENIRQGQLRLAEKRRKANGQ